jgi:hypothetical protein
MTFANRILDFYASLEIEEKLPEGIEILNPYKKPDVMEACTTFYKKYYNDSKGRVMILGINPGRFGAGITGIPFTDPVCLEKECGIKNRFDKRAELSSDFVYRLVNKMGGPDHFFRHFYLGAVSPLGFVKNGKNYNYYDSRELTHTLKSFIIKSLIEQIGFGIVFKRVYVLGQGKNYDYLKMLNLDLKLFDELIPLPHPRWVMQYRRKQLDEILDETIKTLIT